jgi:hypothetical protein
MHRTRRPSSRNIETGSTRQQAKRHWLLPGAAAAREDLNSVRIRDLFLVSKQEHAMKAVAIAIDDSKAHKSSDMTVSALLSPGPARRRASIAAYPTGGLPVASAIGRSSSISRSAAPSSPTSG